MLDVYDQVEIKRNENQIKKKQINEEYVRKIISSIKKPKEDAANSWDKLKGNMKLLNVIKNN